MEIKGICPIAPAVYNDRGEVDLADYSSCCEKLIGLGAQALTLFGIAGDRGVVTGLTWKAITDIYDDLYFGRIAAEGQYPGYDLSLENP